MIYVWIFQQLWICWTNKILFITWISVSKLCRLKGFIQYIIWKQLVKKELLVSDIHFVIIIIFYTIFPVVLYVLKFCCLVFRILEDENIIGIEVTGLLWKIAALWWWKLCVISFGFWTSFWMYITNKIQIVCSYTLLTVISCLAFWPCSYDRIQPDTWSGAYQCWGQENREAPLRTACPPGVPDGLVSNFEIKSFDGCANPHLGLASIIASGIDGLRKHLQLPVPVGKIM